MSLLSWWPLNGDSKDRGVLSNDLIESNVSVSSAGKINKCYSVSGTNSHLVSSNKQILSSFVDQFSVSCWVKINSWTTYCQTIWSFVCGSVGWNDIAAGFFKYANSNTFCFTVGNGSSATSTNCITPEISLGVWYNFVCTYNSGAMSIYSNGALVSSYTTTIVPSFLSFANGSCFSIGQMANSYAGSSFTYQNDCLINDVRIYDVALSKKEIIDISECCILHYDFNDPYVEDTANLMDGYSASWGALTVNCSYSKNAGVYTLTTTSLIGSYTNASLRMYLVPYTVLVGGVYYSLSFKYKLISGTDIGLSFDWCDTGTITSKTIEDRGDYKIYKVEGMTRSEYTSTYRFLDFDSIGVDSSYNIWDIQLEQKSYCTPYTASSRSGELVYDSSGYGYNGVVTNGLSVVLNDNTGYGSYYGVFTGYSSTANYITSSYYAQQWAYSESERSMSFWFFTSGSKTRNIVGTKNYFWLIRQVGTSIGFVQWDSTGNHKNTMNLSAPGLIMGAWNYCVVTWDNLTIKIYINGVLKSGQNATTTSASVNRTNEPLRVGGYTYAWGSATQGFFDGYLADFKIYQSCLSADRILQGYQNKLSVDRVSNLFTGEVSENKYNYLTTEYLQEYVVSSSSSGSGNWVQRGGFQAMDIRPAPFYYSGDPYRILHKYFKNGTQYLFNIYIDVDSSVSEGEYVAQGICIKYTDGTTDNSTLVAISVDGAQGWQFKHCLSEKDKTIYGINFYYNSSRPAYYRYDSSIVEYSSSSITKKNQLKAGEMDENESNYSIFKQQNGGITKSKSINEK